MTTTNVTNGVTLSDAGWANDVDTATYSGLTVVAGTNTITATGPASLTVHGAGKGFTFVPANTNTGATTINPTCNSVALGAKSIFWNGVACVGGELRANIPVRILYDGTQYHITGNGFNAPFLDTHPIAVGSGDSTKKVRIEADGLTTATTRVLTVRDADFDIGAATQAEQETGSSLVASVTPGRQQFHPSAVKGWGFASVTGTINASYGLTSVTDNGTGDITFNWATVFSSANYFAIAQAVNGFGLTSGTTFTSSVVPSSFAAGTTRAQTARVDTGALVDPSSWMCAVCGDQ